MNTGKPKRVQFWGWQAAEVIGKSCREWIWFHTRSFFFHFQYMCCLLMNSNLLNFKHINFPPITLWMKAWWIEFVLASAPQWECSQYAGKTLMILLVPNATCGLLDDVSPPSVSCPRTLDDQWRQLLDHVPLLVKRWYHFKEHKWGLRCKKPHLYM